MGEVATVILDSGAGEVSRRLATHWPEVAKLREAWLLWSNELWLEWFKFKIRTFESNSLEIAATFEIWNWAIYFIGIWVVCSVNIAYPHPEDLAGMVLVDVAHERMYEETPARWVELNKRRKTGNVCGASYGAHRYYFVIYFWFFADGVSKISTCNAASG